MSIAELADLGAGEEGNKSRDWNISRICYGKAPKWCFFWGVSLRNAVNPAHIGSNRPRLAPQTNSDPLPRPSPSSHNNISFIGVARISDKAVVASLAYNSTVDLAGVKNVLNEKIGMQAGTHYSFSIGQTTWHLMADTLGRVFIAITASSYPTRVGEC